MGIHDRDYYRTNRVGARSFIVRTVVGRIILINIVVFVLQLFFEPFTRFLACSSSDLFGGFPQVWKLVTACFAHSTRDLMHIAFNMLCLFFFGRELEQIYGKRDFLTLYLIAGALAILCEASITQMMFDPRNPEHFFSGIPNTERVILGASGSVMAVVVLFATFFPHRTVLLFFIIPMPIWVVCVLTIAIDLMGIQSGGTGVAHWAHLAGAAFGLGYRYFDLRWESVVNRLRRVTGSRGQFRMPRKRRRSEPRGEDSTPSHVSERIDEILSKIHRDGMASLTEEERQFLLANSRRYRSR